ncbi:MAG: LytTR family transcriptional regulator DNA-binding domain-containing protein [Flavobacteriaceae bacterium]|nr:LytTR family transcriptional regulator DNA-binding domain-containing protein [Flavobacteriaceae bacterium]
MEKRNYLLRYYYYFKKYTFPVYVITIFFSHVLITTVTAQNKKSLNKNIDILNKIDFITYTSIYKTSENLNVQKADSLISNNGLLPAKESPSQGFSKDYFWIHFKINWKSHKSPLLLELNNPHIDNVLLFEKTGSIYNKIGYGGDRNQTFSNRVYKNRRFIFPLKKKLEETNYFLMVDKRNASVSFPLYLWNKDRFEVEETKQNIYYSFYFSVLFIIAFASLLIGLLLPSKIFIYYGLYAFFMALYLFTALGFSFEYLYPNAKHFNNYSRVILMLLIAIAANKFLSIFLNIKAHSPKILRYLRFCNKLLIGLILGWILFSGLYKTYTIVLLNITYIIFLSIFILVFIASYRALKSKPIYANIFFIAFSFIILGAALYLAIEYGIIDESVFPIHPMLLGFGLEIITLSIVMIQQFISIYKNKNTIEKEKRALEKQNLDLKSHTKKLKTIIDTKPNTHLNIVLKSKAKLHTSNIQYIKSDGPYLEFYLHNKPRPEIDRNTIKWALSILPASTFIQIHRSTIVNSEYVKIVKANSLLLKDGKSLNISRNHKEAVKDVFETLKTDN